MKDIRLIIISGLSGSGKSYAIKSFEDMGFFCIDNLPLPLLPKFVELCSQSGAEIKKIALGMDIRERDFLSGFFHVFDSLKREGYNAEILFLEASDEVLIRRFSETRRPHPLAKNRPVIEGIRLERESLFELRSRADAIIDTSNYNVHELKDLITIRFSHSEEERKLNITLISFGYKHGLPYDLDLLYDVRFIQNPNFQPALKNLSGEDKKVVEFIMQKPETLPFIEKISDMLFFLLPLYKQEGKYYLTIGIGCTGGRHRSVAITNQIRQILAEKGYNSTVIHRDIGK